MEARDACEACHGEKGGVPGNEVVVNGVVLCDYCAAERIVAKRFAEMPEGPEKARLRAELQDVFSGMRAHSAT